MWRVNQSDLRSISVSPRLTNGSRCWLPVDSYWIPAKLARTRLTLKRRPWRFDLHGRCIAYHAMESMRPQLNAFSVCCFAYFGVRGNRGCGFVLALPPGDLRWLTGCAPVRWRL